MLWQDEAFHLLRRFYVFWDLSILVNLLLLVHTQVQSCLFLSDYLFVSFFSIKYLQFALQNISDIMLCFLYQYCSARLIQYHSVDTSSVVMIVALPNVVSPFYKAANHGCSFDPYDVVRLGKMYNHHISWHTHAQLHKQFTWSLVQGQLYRKNKALWERKHKVLDVHSNVAGIALLITKYN